MPRMVWIRSRPSRELAGRKLDVAPVDARAAGTQTERQVARPQHRRLGDVRRLDEVRLLGVREQQQVVDEPRWAAVEENASLR